MKRSSDEVDLTIPMLPEMELAASKTAAAVAEFMKLEEDKVDEIRLALIEACLNAIGHSKSKDRRVYITSRYTRTSWRSPYRISERDSMWKR